MGSQRVDMTQRLTHTHPHHINSTANMSSVQRAYFHRWGSHASVWCQPFHLCPGFHPFLPIGKTLLQRFSFISSPFAFCRINLFHQSSSWDHVPQQLQLHLFTHFETELLKSLVYNQNLFFFMIKKFLSRIWSLMSLFAFEVWLTYKTMLIVTQHYDSIFLYLAKWSLQV